MGNWIDGRRWNPQEHKAKRLVKTSAFRTKTLAISAIDSSELIQLKDLSSRGLVVARMTGDPESPEVLRYGIGGANTQGKQLRQAFYVVIGPYAEKRSYPRSGDAQSREISSWQLFGVDQSGSLVFVSRGTFRWCRHAHGGAVRKSGAQFIITWAKV